MTGPDLGTGAGATGEERGRSTLWQTLAFGALVVVVILIVLMLWNPLRGDREVADEGRRPGLVGAVSGVPASETYVGVWMRQGQDVGALLARHGMGDASVLFSEAERGYYVIDIGERDPQAAAAELKGDSSLYDAGLVYEEPVTSEDTASAEATATP